MFKQEMARVNVDILGISELKWTGMGEFHSDDHYIYYCGQESLRRNGVAIMANKSQPRQVRRGRVLTCPGPGARSEVRSPGAGRARPCGHRGDPGPAGRHGAGTFGLEAGLAALRRDLFSRACFRWPRGRPASSRN